MRRRTLVTTGLIVLTLALVAGTVTWWYPALAYTPCCAFEDAPGTFTRRLRKRAEWLPGETVRRQQIGEAAFRRDRELGLPVRCQECEWDSIPWIARPK